MLRLIRSLLLICCAVLVTACEGTPIAPAEIAHNVPAAISRGVVASVSPYACFVSSAMPLGAPYRYRYQKPDLHFPKSALALDGTTTTYRYRMWGASREEPVYVANCVIPATREAVQIMNRKFGVREQKPKAGEATLMGETCVTDGLCTIDGLEVNACQNGNEWPDCDTKAPEEEPVCNPYMGECGGGWSGGEGSGGGSGGGSSCTSCTPSTPTLTCPASVQRGVVFSCTVTANGSGFTAGQWRWQPDNSTTVTTPVLGPSNLFAWTGPAVVGGSVSVPLTDSTGVTNTLTGTFAVTARTWRWSSADWSFTQGTSTANCSVQEPQIGSPTLLGWHVGVGTCSGQPMRPDLTSTPRSGYTVQQVSWGPNAGIWYVTGVQFRMETESGMNPGITAGGARRLLTNYSQVQACRTNAPQHYPAGQPVYVNLWEFNERCKRHSLSAFHNGIWAHEGYGSTGTNGHESRLRMAAAQVGNDPRAVLEAEVAETEADLHGFVNSNWWAVANRLSSGADPNHTFVKNNWSGSVWVWDPSISQFTFAAITPSP